MVIFTALVKILSTNFFCNTKVAGFGKIFIQTKFSRIILWYVNLYHFHIQILAKNFLSHACRNVYLQIIVT